MGLTGMSYQATKLLTAAQYAKLQSGFVVLPVGITILSATPNASGTYCTVVFQGTGLGSLFQLQAIPCSMTVGVTEVPGATLRFGPSGVGGYHGTGPLAGGVAGASF